MVKSQPAITELPGKLSSMLLRKRKTNVIHELAEKIMMTEEMVEGYCFTFNYSEEVLFRLAEFIKLEKELCPFFDFTLSTSRNTKTLSLSLEGPEGTKEFIRHELEMA